MITLDNNGVGYLIYTPNPYSFNINEDYKVYIYHHIREDESSLYGFKTIEDKELFLKLLSVKGLGPKMALPIIASSTFNGIADAINRENVLYLKKFPKIGDKLAKQIILDLKGKLEVNASLVGNDYTDELYEVLKGLGYSDKDVKNIIPRINRELSLEEQIKEALKLMLK
jgi:Holliday junction DNA helicase RuvA